MATLPNPNPIPIQVPTLNLTPIRRRPIPTRFRRVLN